MHRRLRGSKCLRSDTKSESEIEDLFQKLERKDRLNRLKEKVSNSEEYSDLNEYDNDWNDITSSDLKYYYKNRKFKDYLSNQNLELESILKLDKSYPDYFTNTEENNDDDEMEFLLRSDSEEALSDSDTYSVEEDTTEYQNDRNNNNDGENNDDYEDSADEENHESTEIPQLSSDDIIHLANNIMNSSNNRNGLIRIRFPFLFRAGSSDESEQDTENTGNTTHDNGQTTDGNNQNIRIDSSNNDNSDNVRVAREIILMHRDRVNIDPNNRRILHLGNRIDISPVLNRVNLDERPLWVKIFDSVSKIALSLVILRLLRKLISMPSFSGDIWQDTADFMLYLINNKTMAESNSTILMEDEAYIASESFLDPKNSTLIVKFANIILNEIFESESHSYFSVGLSILSFFVYNIVFSLFVIFSFAFLILCLTCSLGRRWNTVEKLVAKIFKEGCGCF
ncbi:hypothetical protein B5S28_g1725 [[Candida] boidinii]|nr:hypothetical protein B5S28_g1725 [[Candida] boidinii]OWB59341.1 hypothetical protein B5S29_g197 [[Candida] boidinii]OWB72456.1 hypothetical protein B5S31_g2168 [[Candida] boidinii]OWB77511.1 hypothetical protein B5S32_g1679 [[Candida] boidinii]